MGCAGSKGVPDGDASKGRTEQSPVSPPATASRPEELSQVAQAAEVANDAGSGRLQTVSPVISVAPVGTGEVKVTSDDDRADGVDVQRAEEPETPQSQGSESPRPFYEEQEQENRNAEPSEHGSDAFQSPQNENMKAALQPGTTRAPEEPDAEVLAHRSSFTPLTR